MHEIVCGECDHPVDLRGTYQVVRVNSEFNGMVITSEAVEFLHEGCGPSVVMIGQVHKAQRTKARG